MLGERVEGGEVMPGWRGWPEARGGRSLADQLRPTGEAKGVAALGRGSGWRRGSGVRGGGGSGCAMGKKGGQVRWAWARKG